VGSYTFSGPNAVLTWTIPDSAFAIDHYTIYYGDAYKDGDTVVATEVGTTKGTLYAVNVTWGGMRRYWVVGFDVAGNVGEPEQFDVMVASPGAVGTITPRVIDNNVLLQWSAPTTGSLPVSYYARSKGDVYESSTDIGTVTGTFSVIFEQEAGSYKYWIVALDSAGNEGTPVAIPATVSQPPDYEILRDWSSTFSGEKTSAMSSDGYLYAPINITETYQEHFVNNSYSTPAEQVADGYNAWIMPVPTTGTYREVFDYETLISVSTNITMEISRDASKEWGNVTITPSIEVSTDNVTYGTPVEAWSSLESGFRYVRVTLSFASTAGLRICAIGNLRVKLDLKQISDAGRVEVTDNPTQVNFATSFIDITSITVAAEGTTALFAVYDFTDAPNPTHCHVYLFDAGGGDASGTGKYVSWTAKGV